MSAVRSALAWGFTTPTRHRAPSHRPSTGTSRDGPSVRRPRATLLSMFACKPSWSLVRNAQLVSEPPQARRYEPTDQMAFQMRNGTNVSSLMACLLPKDTSAKAGHGSTIIRHPRLTSHTNVPNPPAGLRTQGASPLHPHPASSASRPQLVAQLGPRLARQQRMSPRPVSSRLVSGAIG